MLPAATSLQRPRDAPALTDAAAEISPGLTRLPCSVSSSQDHPGRTLALDGAHRTLTFDQGIATFKTIHTRAAGVHIHVERTSREIGEDGRILASSPDIVLKIAADGGISVPRESRLPLSI